MMKLFYAETAQMIAIAEEEEQIQQKVSGQIEKQVESDDESASASGSESWNLFFLIIINNMFN